MSDAERTMMFQLPNQLSGKLVCVGGTMAGRTFELSGGTFTIGRASDSDLCLVDEPGVSKQHAKIVGQGSTYAVVDCESRNGTFVNGEAVSPQRALSDGDEIRICGCILRLQQTGAGPARTRSTSTIPRTAPATAPYMPALTQEVAAEEPSYEAPPVTLPPPMEPPPPPRSHVPALAGWFAAGLAGMVVVGGVSGFMLTDTPAIAAVVPTKAAPPAVAVVDAPKPPDANHGLVPPPPENGTEKAVEKAVEPPAAAAATKEVIPPASDPKEDQPEEVVDATDNDGPSPSRRKNNARKPTKTTPAAEEPAAAAEEPAAAAEEPAVAAAGAGKSFAASPDVRSEVINTKGGGRVKSVAFADGADVDKGETLVMFDAGGSEEEVATLQDRIASLQSAEGDDAQRELKAAKSKLQALLASAKSPPVVAPMTGKLSGFAVQPGQVVKAGDVLGKMIEADAPARVKISVDKSVKAKTGQGVVLELRTGATAQGSVIAVSGKTVFVDTGGSAPEQVARVRFE
jgi:hypothetical protein